MGRDINVGRRVGVNRSTGTDRQPARRAVRRRVNLRLILVFVAVLLVVMVAEYFVVTALQPDVDQLVAQKLQEAMASSAPGTTAATAATPEPTTIATTGPTTQPSASPTADTTPEPDDPLLALPISFDKIYTDQDTGEEVVFIQQMLIDLGFNPGRADGIYGEMLGRAILEFQMYSGIEADGKAGPNTVHLLAEKWLETQNPEKSDSQPLAGFKIGLDPGHQEHSNAEKEKVSPTSSETKSKVSGGTYGRFTGVSEYVINLQVALRLKRELEALGAEVVMTRTVHDIDISNSERAIMMNKADVDCWLRIHANGNNDKSVHGMFILIPKQGTMNTDDESVAETSRALATVLIDETMKETGATSPYTDGLSVRSDQTGFSWSSVPVCNIEMGHMTNEKEDWLLISEAYQIKIVQGLVNGFVAFFEAND